MAIQLEVMIRVAVPLSPSPRMKVGLVTQSYLRGWPDGPLGLLFAIDFNIDLKSIFRSEKLCTPAFYSEEEMKAVVCVFPAFHAADLTTNLQLANLIRLSGFAFIDPTNAKKKKKKKKKKEKACPTVSREAASRVLRQAFSLLRRGDDRHVGTS